MTKRTSFKSITLGGAAAWAMTLAAAAHAQEGEKRHFDIEAQPLARALLEFNEQSGVLVMAPQALVEGKTAPAIEGEITADEALDRILSGSGLKSNASDSGAITITLASAETIDPGSFQMTQRQNAPTRQIESADEDQGEGDASVIEVIIVTGTNIRGVENPTSPLLQYDAEDLAVSGVGTIQDFIRTIPQNFNSSSPVAANSGNPFAPSGGNNITDGSTIDLRGLGAGSTLILINGRRIAPSGDANFFDISALPFSAIERVDVLTDGASATYGTDAVGGVVNFITQRDFEGLELRSRYGAVTDGGYNELQLGATGSLNWSTGNALANVEFTGVDSLRIGDRDFIDQEVAFSQGTLFPEQETLNLFSSVSQNLTDRLRVTADIMYADREVETNSFEESAAQIGVNTTKSFYVNTNLNYKILESWAADLYFDYGEQNTEFSSSFDDFEGVGERENTLYVFEGIVSREVAALPGGSLSAAFGAQYRNEKFNPVGRDVTGEPERDISAVFGEVLIPVVGDSQSVPLIKSLIASLAGRYEYYSDFGGTFNPKFGIAWKVNDQFLLRGTYGESFRAPTLNTQFTPRNYIFTNFPDPLLDPAQQDPRAPDGQALLLVEIGGNPDLEPEESENWTLGFEFNPGFVPGFRIEGSYYDISYNNRIESLITIEPFVNPDFSPLVDRSPSAATLSDIFSDIEAGTSRLINVNRVGITSPTPSDVQVLVNSGSQNVSALNVNGFDLQLRYDGDLAGGSFSSTFNTSYITDYDIQISAVTDPFSVLNQIYRPTDLRFRGTVSWERDGFTCFAALNYVDEYEDNQVGNANDKVGSWTTLDITGAYEPYGNRLLNGVRVAASIQNVFDEDPPLVATADGLNFDTANASPLGRFISFEISKRF